MNEKECLVCGRPLTGMRRDAKVHQACKWEARDPAHVASLRFWKGVQHMSSRGLRVWLAVRETRK